MADVEETITKPSRRSDLDIMGPLIVLGLIFFHTARIFDLGDFYVKNDPTSVFIMLVLALVALFGMPLLFLVAGMSIWYSLKKRTAKEFVNERFFRLFIPLIVGVFLLIPPQVWTRVIWELPIDDRNTFFDLKAYLEFYSQFFSITIDLLNFPFIFKATQSTGYFETGHLWFLVMLFTYSLFLLPIFIYLRRESSFHLIDKFGNFFDKSWTIFILAIPISLIEVVLTAELYGGWNRYVYALLIIYGFLLASDKRMGKSFQKHWKDSLIFSVFLSMFYIVTVVIFAAILQTDPLISYDLWSILWRILKGITGWCWIIAILGFFASKTQSQKEQLSEDKITNSQGIKRILNPETMGTIGQYANQAQLPVYVLHQTIIVIVAFFIVPLNLNLYIKFLIISLLSLAVTLLFYDIGVKRLRITRFLFGMKR